MERRKIKLMKEINKIYGRHCKLLITDPIITPDLIISKGVIGIVIGFCEEDNLYHVRLNDDLVINIKRKNFRLIKTKFCKCGKIIN